MYEYTGNDEQIRELHVSLRKYIYERLQTDLDFSMGYIKHFVSEKDVLNRVNEEILKLKEYLKAMEIFGPR